MTTTPGNAPSNKLAEQAIRFVVNRWTAGKVEYDYEYDYD